MKKERTGTKRFRFLKYAVVLLLLFLMCDMRLTVKHYTLEDARINAPIRIALVTDLHSCYYGKNQQNLIRAIDAQQPDLLLLGGDLFDDVLDSENVRLFLEGIRGKYPCYYVTGNHEYWAGPEKFQQFMDMLENYGVVNLSNDWRCITLNGEVINLCGVDDPSNYSGPSVRQQTRKLKANVDETYFTVVLAHRPECFSDYRKNGYDLALCGHAHGGQWRIPGIMNGLYSPNQGFFPQYAGGLYRQDQTTMIVSRGLARESTLIPRIFNRPELVIVDLQ